MTDELDQIAASLPQQPEDLAGLRVLLRTLPSPTQPVVLSARSGVVGADGSTPGANLTIQSPVQIGEQSGAAVGRFAETFYGQTNILDNPEFVGFSGIALTGSFAQVAPKWEAERILNSGTAPTITINGTGLTRFDSFTNPSNSALAAINISAITQAYDVDIYLRPNTAFVSDITDFAYLVAAARFLAADVELSSKFTKISLTMQVADVSFATIVAESTEIIVVDANGDPAPAFLDKDFGARIWASLAWAASADTFGWQLRIHLIKSVDAGSVGSGPIQLRVGEPLFAFQATQDPGPYSPIIGKWIPDRLEAYGTSGANFVPVLNVTSGSAGGVILFSSGVAAGDTRIIRSAAKVLRVDDGAGGRAALEMVAGTNPGTAIASTGRLWFNTANKHFYQTDDAGTQIDLAAGGGGGVSLGGAAGSAHIGTAGAIGAAVTAAESDHQHPAQISLSAGVAGSGNYLARQKLAADAQYRFLISLDGSDRGAISFSGGTTLDLQMYRQGAGILTLSALGTANQTRLNIESTAGQLSVLQQYVAGDTVARYQSRGDAGAIGILLGDGSAQDVRFLRSAAGQITMDSNSASASTVLNVVSTSGQQSAIGAAVAGDSVLRARLSGDATTIGLLMSSGGATADVRFARTAAATIKFDSNSASAATVLTIEATSAQLNSLAFQVAGDTSSRLQIQGNATNVHIIMGPGNAAQDVRIRRSAAKTVLVDDNAGGNLTLVNFLTASLQRAGTEVSLVGHGAADHTDITRKIDLNAEQATLDAATFASLGASPDQTRVVAYADAATQGAFWNFMVPSDWASGAITIQPVWSPGATDAVAHTVRWSFVAKAIAAGSTVTAAGTTVTWTGASAARTVGVVVYDTATSTTITPAAAGDFFRIEVRRIGADAADTYVGVVNLIGLIVSYTATQ